jgi:hypothetical protein
LGWKGIDGTIIPSVPKNALFGYAPDLKKLAASADFQKLKALGTPLIFAWEEFGWESPEQPAYLTAPARYNALGPIEFVTIKEYLDKYGAPPDDTVYFPMDAWTKSLTWGLGGDQVRILDRKVDALLLAAELFDAAAAGKGRPSQAAELDKAWRDLLASQSHDVGLCEYSRWQGDRMAPFDRVEDKHNFTWGAIGYNHLDTAQKQGQEASFRLTDPGRVTPPPAGAGSPPSCSIRTHGRGPISRGRAASSCRRAAGRRGWREAARRAFQISRAIGCRQRLVVAECHSGPRGSPAF